MQSEAAVWVTAVPVGASEPGGFEAREVCTHDHRVDANSMAPERAFFKLLVKEGHEQEYVDRHAAVWPEVTADLQGEQPPAWLRSCPNALPPPCLPAIGGSSANRTSNRPRWLTQPRACSR